MFEKVPLTHYQILATFGYPSKRLSGVYLKNPNGGPLRTVFEDLYHQVLPTDLRHKFIEVKPSDW